MRIIRPLIALLVALSVAAAVLTYMSDYTRENRIYPSAHRRSSADYHLLRNWSYRGDASRQGSRAAPGDSDPYRQRYYSESEGWTYFTLPSYSSGRGSNDH
jgi:hypothetical protein